MSMINKNTKTELIQEHWLQDVYRLENGTRLTVNKFKQLHWGWVDLKAIGVKKEKIKGIKNCYRIKEDITHWADNYKTDQLFLGGLPIDVVESGEYLFKLSSNEYISGNNDYMLYMTNEIQRIVKLY